MSKVIIIVTVVLSLAVLFVISHLHHSSESLVPPLTTLTKWNWKQGANSYDTSISGSVSVDAGAVRIDVLKVDDNGLWKLQYHYIGLRLKPNQKYNISYEVKASVPYSYQVSAYSCVVNPRLPFAGGHSLGLTEDLQASTEWTKKSITFTAKDTDGLPDQFPIFNVGAMVGTLWLKDLKVVEVN